MKKIVLGIVLIGIIVVVGAPFANGLIAERLAHKALQDLNQLYSDTGSPITIEILEYERGFSSSKIKWKVAMGNYKLIPGIQDIVVVEDATHGYMGVVSKSSFTENKWYADVVHQRLNGKDPLHITTQYSMLGNIESTIALDAFSIKEGQNIFESKPGKMVITCGDGFTKIGSKGSYAGLAMNDELRLDEITIDSKMEMISPYIWKGNGSVSVANCKALAKHDLIKAANLTFNYAMDYQKKSNTISMGAEYGADNFAYDEYRIDHPHVRIDINGVDAQGYENLMTMYSKMANSAMDGMAQAQDDPEKMEALMQQQMMTSGLQLVTAFEKMLKKGLELKISDLKATLPQGQVQGNLALGLKKDMTMAQFIPMAGQPKLALDTFSLQSAVSLPAQLVGEDPTLFRPIYPGMQTGLFQRNGDLCVHKAETKDGKLYLNGQEVLLN